MVVPICICSVSCAMLNWQTLCQPTTPIPHPVTRLVIRYIGIRMLVALKIRQQNKRIEYFVKHIDRVQRISMTKRLRKKSPNPLSPYGYICFPSPLGIPICHPISFGTLVLIESYIHIIMATKFPAVISWASDQNNCLIQRGRIVIILSSHTKEAHIMQSSHHSPGRRLSLIHI